MSAVSESTLPGAELGSPVRADGAETAAEGASRLRRAIPFLVVLVVSGVLSALYYHAGWRSPTNTYSAAVGDPEYMIWFLAWVPHALLQGHTSLLSNYQLYPAGENLMWNSSIVLPSILLSPVTLAAGPVVSFNLLLTLAPVATACTAYFAFSRYVRSSIAAVIGAITFGFCPFLLHQQNGHEEVSLLALLPVTLLLLDEILVRQRWRWWLAGGALGVVAGAQLLTGEELLTIEILMAVVGIITLAVIHRSRIREKAPYALAASALAAAVFAVLAVVPLAVQFLGPRRTRPIHPAKTFETDVVNFFQPVLQVIKANVVNHVAFSGNAVEWSGYIGFPLLVVILFTVVRDWRRRPIVPVAFVIFAVFALLTLGPQLHVNGRVGITLPWAAFEHLPLLKDVLPARLTVALDLSACLLFTVFIDDVVASSRWVTRVLGGALTALVILFWLPVAPPVTSVPVPAFFTTSAKNVIPAGSVAVVTPYVYGPLTEAAVVWQAASGMRYRMVDGWMIVPGSHSGPATVVSGTLARLEHGPVTLTPQLSAAIMGYLHGDKVRTIIVGPGPGEVRTFNFFARLFHSSPETRTGGVSVFRVPAGT